MIVTRERAIVFRGGGRRWFTEQAAYNAAAKQRIRSRCYCSGPDPAPYYEQAPPEICQYHDMDPDEWTRLRDRLGRFLRFLDARAGDE